ncbi:MAG: SGNH/GDSL hydrolase family protein, partial [Phycicoccus sp.]
MWSRYVAIGDSFTEGLCDPDPDDPARYVGWADRLAAHLDSAAEAEHLPFAYANLAVRGRTLTDVVGPQLDAALALGPDLVSMVGGGNDLLRPRVDLDGLADRLEQAVARIRRAGADVLLATPTDTR